MTDRLEILPAEVGYREDPTVPIREVLTPSGLSRVFIMVRDKPTSPGRSIESPFPYPHPFDYLWR